MSSDDRPPRSRRPHRPASLAAVFCAVLLTVLGCTGAAEPPEPTSGSSLPSSPDTATPGPTTPGPTTATPTSSGASTTAPELDPLTIGLVGPGAVGTFGQEAAASITTELEAADAVVVSCDPGEDHAQLLECVRRMTAQQVDGWVLMPETELGELDCATGLPDAPLITIGAPTGCEVAVVGPDDTEAGRSVGTELAARARAGAGCADSVLIVVGNAAAPRSAARAAGIATGYTTGCRSAEPVVIDATGQEQAYVALETALAAIEPDTAVLIGAVEDSLALGALAAVPDARSEQVQVAAIGADLRARCTLRQDPRWIGDAAFFAERYGAVVAPALLKAIDGRTIPAELTIGSQFVDVDSIDSYYPELECPTS